MAEIESFAMSYPELVVEYLNRLEERLRTEIALQCAYDAHEWFYGTPCGPTLSMVDPTTLGYAGLSLADAVESARGFLESKYAELPRWLDYDPESGVMGIEVRP